VLLSNEPIYAAQIEALREKRKNMKLGGGQEAIDKRHNRGQLSAWERIEYFFDDGTFVEVGAYIELRNEFFGLGKKKVLGDGVVTGFGLVNGRLVYAAAQDFTVIGGSLGEMHGKKIANLMDMALQNGAPFVSLNDSAGARVQEGIGALCGYGDIFMRNTRASGVIPQISVIMGPCAGGAVYSPGITDFVVMVKDTSYMFITGPDVIKTVTGETISQENLGGSEMHSSKSGVVTYVGENDQDALDWVKRLLSYLPSSNMENPPIVNVVPSLEMPKDIEELVPANFNKPYEMSDVVKNILDIDSFLELQENYARNIIIGLGRLGGTAIGIVANNPKESAGSLDVNASDKAARFVRFCDAFNIPLVALVDVPGFLPGSDQEYNGIIRHGAKLLYAYAEATVPKLTVILRKSYGGAYICMCSKHLGADFVAAWPGAEIAVMGPDGAVNFAFKKEIDAVKEAGGNVEAKREECKQEYINKFANPAIAASRGYIDDVIDPSKTRSILLVHLKSLAAKRQDGPKRKHGNIPL
jgi:acetyl-CoA carboxylase carboxyltransferase component